MLCGSLVRPGMRLSSSRTLERSFPWPGGGGGWLGSRSGSRIFAAMSVVGVAFHVLEARE